MKNCIDFTLLYSHLTIAFKSLVLFSFRGQRPVPSPGSSMPNFTPSVQRQGCTTPKIEILLRFDRSVEYKRPAGAYPLRDFHKICRVCTTFQDALGVKILLDLLKGLWSYGGFKLRVSACPKFSAPPSGETMRQTPKRFRGARTPSRSSITMPFLVGVGFHPPAGQPKRLSFFVCLFVCLSVRHAFERQIVRPISPWRHWSTEMILISLDREGL